MELALRRSGYVVASAPDYESARREFSDANPSLIVLDLDSAKDVESLIAQIKGPGAPWRQTPCIYICSETSRVLIKEDLRPGSEDCMARPLYLQELGTRVALVLNQKRRARWSGRDQARIRFSGQITELGVVDLLQTIDHCKKSGVVNLEAEGESGQLWFSDGKLIDASFGQLQAEAAVYRMIRLESGRYGVQFKPVRRARAMGASIQDLLHEGLIQLDKWHRLCEQLPSLDHPLSANIEQLMGPGSDSPSSDVRALLRRFAGNKTIRSVIQETRRNDLELLEVISEVYFSGALMEVREGNENDISIPDEDQEEREDANAQALVQDSTPKRRPSSMTEPMLGEKPVFAKRPKVKTQLMRDEELAPAGRPRSSSSSVARERGPHQTARLMPNPASDRSGARPRFVRTQIIPRPEGQGPSMAQDAPVLGDSSASVGARRPISATIMYHEDEDAQRPFQSNSANTALAHDPGEYEEPVYQSPPAANDDPNLLQEQIKAHQRSCSDDAGEVFAHAPASAELGKQVQALIEEAQPELELPSIKAASLRMEVELNGDQRISSIYSLAATVGCVVTVALVLAGPLWKSVPAVQPSSDLETDAQRQNDHLLDPGAVSPDEGARRSAPRARDESANCCASYPPEAFVQAALVDELSESLESRAQQDSHRERRISPSELGGKRDLGRSIDR